MSVIDLVKNNKLMVLLVLAVVYLLARPLAGPVGLKRSFEDVGLPVVGGRISESEMMVVPPREREIAPSDSADRLVITETSLSEVVDDVAGAIDKIQDKAEQLGGFLVSSRLTKPEEAASGSIIVRVPEERLSEALDSFRAVGLRVVDEQVNGRDVTDRYEDLEARLSTLEKTKVKFEEIFDKAVRVEDILRIQRELVSLQSQIDNVKGQQQYLEKSAKLAKVTVYLSTDEFSLPYSPAEPWRPEAVFKLAVRSLVSSLRGVGTGLIWVVVYSPVWLTVLVAFWLVKKRVKI